MDVFRRNPAITAGVIIFFGVMFVATLLHESHELNQWFWRWQALIGGALAIFAAFVTVNEMRISANEQSNHHREIVALSLRREANAARRSIRVFRGYLLQKHLVLRHELQRNEELYRKFDAATDPEEVAEYVGFHALVGRLQELETIGTSPEFQELLSIADDKIVEAVEEVSLWATLSLHPFGDRRIPHHVDWPTAKESYPQLLDGPHTLGGLIRPVLERIEKVGLLLGELSDFYDNNSPRVF